MANSAVTIIFIRVCGYVKQRDLSRLPLTLTHNLLQSIKFNLIWSLFCFAWYSNSVRFCDSIRFNSIYDGCENEIFACRRDLLYWRKLTKTKCKYRINWKRRWKKWGNFNFILIVLCVCAHSYFTKHTDYADDADDEDDEQTTVIAESNLSREQEIEAERLMPFSKCRHNVRNANEGGFGFQQITENIIIIAGFVMMVSEHLLFVRSFNQNAG